MGPAVRIALLGPVTATLDGAPLALGGLKQRAVLAVLALGRGHLVSVDAVIEAVWGEDRPVRAAATLQTYVSHLRRVLEPDARARERSGLIRSGAAGYALDISADSVDAWQFETAIADAARRDDPVGAAQLLADALALWRGPALADYATAPWAEAEAQRLTELRNVARERLVAARLDAGESAILVPDIETLLREDPLREERWRLLVLALYRAHRQADALAALRRARALLADELGVDPGPALRELEVEVLAQSESLEYRTSEPMRGETVSGPTAGRLSPPTDRVSDLVDREDELVLLRSSLAGALAGKAAMSVIEGPPGIGKTSLLNEVRLEAQAAGATVLSGRGSVLEREYGFGVARQLFEPHVVDPARRSALLQGSAATAASIFDMGADLETQARPEGMFAVLHGLYWLTVNLAAAGPVVILVDDLQWCDTGSLRFLAYLVRRIEGTPVYIASTVRTGETSPDDELIGELLNEPSVAAVRPEPLSFAGVADLVRGRLGDGADDLFIRACLRTTSGNPLLLRQLLVALESDQVSPTAGHADTVRAIGSRAISSLVLRRFGRMSDVNRAVARAVCVLGDGASLPHVSALAGRSDAETATAIAELARAEVLRPDSPIGFVHPLVGDAVYGDLTVGERELLHERAAAVLRDSGTAAEQVAAQLMLVPRRGDQGVVETLREAARRDLLRGTTSGAIAYLRRALEEPPAGELRYEVMLDLGTVEASSDGPSAVTHLTESYASITDPDLRANAAIALTRTLVFAGQPGDATQVARQARRGLPEAMVDIRQHLVGLERIAGYMHAVDPATYDYEHPPQVVGESVGARGLAATLSWEALIRGTDRAEAVRLAEFSLEGGALQQVDTGLLWVVSGNTLELAGRDMTRFWDDALRQAYERGTLFAALGATLWHGFGQWRRGDLRDAEQLMRQCTDQNELWGDNIIGQPYVDGFLIRVALDAGDVPRARRIADGAVNKRMHGDGARLYRESVLLTLLAEGRVDEAEAVYDGLHDWMTIVVNPAWRPNLGWRAQILAARGRSAEAAEFAERELRLARDWGTDDLVGRAERDLARYLGPDGLELARQAVARLSVTSARLELAKAQQLLGDILTKRAGARPTADVRSEAVASYEAALRLAHVCGALGMVRDLTAGLQRLGVHVPEPRDADVVLTATERRVASMAVGGALDREIAESMFMTPRTVQLTLRDIYRRLEISTLDQLRMELERS